ncbi:hypothetical protein Tco_0766106 [Tanacetum coccineum]
MKLDDRIYLSFALIIHTATLAKVIDELKCETSVLLKMTYLNFINIISKPVTVKLDAWIDENFSLFYVLIFRVKMGVLSYLQDDGVQQSFTMIFRIESNYPKYYNVLEFRKNGEAIIETRYANNDDIDPIFQVYDLCSGCVTDIGLPWSGRNDFEYSNVSRLSMSS